MPLSILLILPRSFPQAGPSVFAGISSIPPYFGPSFPNTVPMPSQPLPPMVTPRTIPVSFSSTGPQSSFGPRPSGGQSGFPGAPLLEGGELPGAEEAKLLPLPAVKPLPSPATFGLIFNPGEPPPEVPPLMVP